MTKQSSAVSTYLLIEIATTHEASMQRYSAPGLVRGGHLPHNGAGQVRRSREGEREEALSAPLGLPHAGAASERALAVPGAGSERS
jgi:hypothetical protein